MSVTPNGKLTWKTSGENGRLPFVIEQYRWNKWVGVGEVQGKGTEGSNTHEFLISPHSGENTIRVAQFDHSGRRKIF